MEKQADAGAGKPFRTRDGFGIAGAIILLVAVLAVLLLLMGWWKSFARRTAPVLVNLPGGPLTVGGVLGLISVLGVIGALRCTRGTSADAPLARASRAVCTIISCAAAFGPLFYLLGGLPGKNCQPSDTSCAYIPGIGPAFMSFMAGIGVVGWLFHHRGVAREEARASRERERMRKLRKKGKGKSRTARNR
ncbi:hypothetical protein GCM10019016_031580 [Streptomyces prasinosporus]|uniref:Integral membrane protein n=1 Tax=Streptomyces prasinosporus TaxID=68256 RepID=A0ABP6TLF0_9ACTN